MTKRLTPSRWNLYVLGTRRSPVRLIAQELSIWSNLDETLIGAVLLDQIDDDYSYVILARDRIGCFRWVRGEVSISSERRATALLRIEMANITQNESIEELGDQGDETNSPIDLLYVDPTTLRESLHPYFLELSDRPSRAPARAIVREISPWLTPADPHLVSEFQRHQFDQRLWELYLWSAFRELGFDVTQVEAPDFLCSAPGIAFTVEATTAAPSTMGPLSTHPDPKTDAEIQAFLTDYMPMKYGSALHSKLSKRNKDGLHYWERPDAKDKPFVLGIADFHKPAAKGELGSMVYTQSALWMYLYGHRVQWDRDENGTLIIQPTKIEEHQYAGKTIKSGFFDLHDAKNVSAVIFSNAGTLAKFDRMGVVAGFAAEKHKYFRVGERYNPDPNASKGTPFYADVADPSYGEYWSDELQIFHNPQATNPLPSEWFSGINQFWFRDGNLHSLTPEGQVLSSYTMIFQMVGDQEKQEE